MRCKKLNHGSQPSVTVLLPLPQQQLGGTFWRTASRTGFAVHGEHGTRDSRGRLTSRHQSAKTLGPWSSAPYISALRWTLPCKLQLQLPGFPDNHLSPQLKETAKLHLGSPNSLWKVSWVNCRAPLVVSFHLGFTLLC